MLVKELLSENLGITSLLGPSYKIYSYRDFENPDVKEKAFNEAWAIIKKQCKEILNVYSKTYHQKIFLLRGIRESNDLPIIKSGVRTDRKPGFLSMRIHNAVNEVMKEMGMKARRDNSIFCSTNKPIASEWGDVYIIFPKDGFNVTYFIEMQAPYMFSALSNVADEYIEYDISNPDLSEKEKDLWLKKEIKSTLVDNGMSDNKKNLAKAFEQTSEYLISCDSFIGLDYKYFKDYVINALDKSL